jgi:hypothetical protein
VIALEGFTLVPIAIGVAVIMVGLLRQHCAFVLSPSERRDC